MEAGQSRNDGNRAAEESQLEDFSLEGPGMIIPDDVIRAIEVHSQGTEENDYDTYPEDDVEDENNGENGHEDWETVRV